MPGVYTWPLGACILDWYSRRGVLVLGCPKTDAIRVWPLPIQYNWVEDPTPPPFDQVDEVTC